MAVRSSQSLRKKRGLRWTGWAEPPVGDSVYMEASRWGTRGFQAPGNWPGEGWGNCRDEAKALGSGRGVGW